MKKLMIFAFLTVSYFAVSCDKINDILPNKNSASADSTRHHHGPCVKDTATTVL